ncbi:MAG: hypothetical protein K2X81_26805 [Candidatus Obscuribacterales bacterium]|nr:hypothetical protein [Candidatus Obscuribacterales bacterium]
MGRFQDYVNLHRELTSAVVAAPMVIEAITSLLLALQWKRPDANLLWINLGILMIIWISTACCSIPCHEKLCSGGYCESTQHWLVLSNWVRTIGWTLRSAILLMVMWHALEGQQVLPSFGSKN